MDFTRFALDVYVSYCLGKTGLASAASATVQLVVVYISLDGKSLVNPGLRARLYHLMSTIPLFLLYFFGFAAKVISGSDIEMFMRWSHQWMRPINKGSPFGQMCQFPFPYCYIAPFSSFAFPYHLELGKVQIKVFHEKLSIFHEDDLINIKCFYLKCVNRFTRTKNGIHLRYFCPY